MPDPVTGVIAGGTVLGAGMSASASRSASRAQQQAADAATAEQRRQYDISRQDLAPYRQVGTQALNQLGSLYGFTPYQEPQQGPSAAAQAAAAGQLSFGQLTPRGIANRTFSTASTPLFNNGSYTVGDLGTTWMTGGPMATPGGPIKPNAPAQPQGMAGFFASPDYNFRRTEGLRGIEQSAAARGGALSGNALRATTNFSSDLASQEFGNYYNRLANLAGIGQTATNTGVVAGQNYANAAGANAMAAGAARASGIVGQGNAWANGINQLGYGLGQWYANRPPAFNPAAPDVSAGLLTRNRNGFILGG